LASELKWRLDRLKEQISGMFRKESREGRPRLCPACGTLVGSTASRCYQCGANVHYSLGAASKTLSRLMPATSPATYGILLVTALLYAATLGATLHSGAGGPGQATLMGFGGIGGETLFKFGASMPWPDDLIQPWRLVMAIFLHGGLLHIGMNMWVLMDIGPQIEEVFGSARYFFIYVATGVVGFAVSSASGHLSVGGSASLLGLIGVMLAVTTKHGGAQMQMLRNHLLRWLLYIGLFGLFVRGIDNWAHAGGLAAGFLLGRIMVERTPATPQEQRNAWVLGWLAGIMVAGSFIFMALQYFRTA
jgi:rhomboid protease GluP